VQMGGGSQLKYREPAVCLYLGGWKGKEGHGRSILYQWNFLTTCLVRSMRGVVLCGHAMCRQDKRVV
jgi:hypothetical protein